MIARRGPAPSRSAGEGGRAHDGTVSGRLPEECARPTVSLQSWCDLTFLHWRYEAAAVQRLLPPGLTVQALDGSAWVGATPFRMTDVRVPLVPAVPRWSTFPEVNVRTYVRGPDGRDGVFFLSLDCPRLVVLAGMRAAAVPYFWADGEASVERPGSGRSGTVVRYRFVRRGGETRRADLSVRPGVGGAPPGGGPRLSATVRVGPALADDDRSELVDSLTGRWAAYVQRVGRLWRIPVTHEPWPLHEAQVEDLRTSLLGAARLPAPGGEPMVHFSPGVHTRIGVPVPLGR